MRDKRVISPENQIVINQPNETVRLDVCLEKEVQTKEPPLQSIFYQNRFWDAKSLLIKFIRRAKKELIVIDAYPGVATLDMLAKRGRGVKIELVTHYNGELEKSDLEAFGAANMGAEAVLAGLEAA